MATQLSPLDAAGDSLSAMLDLLGGIDALPPGFWQDPFILGFIFYNIDAVITLTAPSAITSAPTGRPERPCQSV